jgi:hypothetical protein
LNLTIIYSSFLSTPSIASSAVVMAELKRQSEEPEGLTSRGYLQ